MGAVSFDRLVQEWRGKAKKDRYCFYSDNILPHVAARLREDIQNRMRTGDVAKYDTLVMIVSHNLHPLLLAAKSFCTGSIVLFHTSDKDNLIEKNKYVFEDLDGNVERVRIDATDHRKNEEIIKNKLKSLTDEGKVLCDITGGKKMLSTLMVLCARETGADVSCIDAERFEFGVPFPGEEIVYVKWNKVSEPRDILRISCESGNTTQMSFDVHTLHESFNAAKHNMKRERTDSFREIIKSKYADMNRAIQYGGTRVKEELDGLASHISSLLPEEVAQYLKKNSGKELSLLLDEETAGIPWEICLHRKYGISLPVFRRPHRDREYERDDTDGGMGVLFIAGPDPEHEIPDYERLIEELKMRLIHNNGDCKNVSRKEELYQLLSNVQCKILIYFGHAVFDSDPEKTGWQMSDGIFTGGDFSALRGNNPEMIISNACQSARSVPFEKNSFAYAVLKYCNSYIGTNWLLEAERSGFFLERMVSGMLKKSFDPWTAYRATFSELEKKFGDDDILLYNYLFYG